MVVVGAILGGLETRVGGLLVGSDGGRVEETRRGMMPCWLARMAFSGEDPTTTTNHQPPPTTNPLLLPSETDAALLPS